MLLLYLLLQFLFRQVLFYDQIVDNEALSLHGVFTHVVFEQGVDIVTFVEGDGFKAHVRTNKVFELIGRNFAQTFESGDFGVGT